MCITMSDQVPVWAKTVHTKMIFSEQELTGMRYDDKVNSKKSERRLSQPSRRQGQVCQEEWLIACQIKEGNLVAIKGEMSRIPADWMN